MAAPNQPNHKSSTFIRTLKNLRPSFTRSHAKPPKLNLLSLPHEIRLQIYQHVVASAPMLHIIRTKTPPRRLRCVCCVDDDPFNKPRSFHNCWHDHMLFVNHKVHPHIFGDPNEEGTAVGNCNLGVMGVLRTCREIYRDASPLLFQHNVFDLLHIDALVMLAQPQYLPPASFHMIRHLRLTFTPSLNFLHSQPAPATPPEVLALEYAPIQSITSPTEMSKDIEALVPSLEDCRMPPSWFDYDDWRDTWSILVRMRSLTTLRCRINALDGPGLDFDAQCSLLRPLMRMLWRRAGSDSVLQPLEKFDVVTHWDEKCFAFLRTALLKEARDAIGPEVTDLPFEFVVEELQNPELSIKVIRKPVWEI